MELISSTPIQRHYIDNYLIHVKREDLCAVPPLPPLAKLRGAYQILQKLSRKGIKLVGHHDTWYSKAGQGITILCKEFGMKCIVGYPMQAGTLPVQLCKARDYGAELYGVKPNYVRVNYSETRNYVRNQGGVMLPFALACVETVNEVAKEAASIHHSLLNGSIVACVGSGTILSGIIKGVSQSTNRYGTPDIYGISAGMSEKKQRENIQRLLFEAGSPNTLHNLHLIPPIMPYAQQDDFDCPFQCHPNYDRKAWHWLNVNIKKLKQPVLFWNIGA